MPTRTPISARTVGELRARASAIGRAREDATAEKLAAEHKRRVHEAERACRARPLARTRRGEGVWREVEAEIEAGTPSAMTERAPAPHFRAVAEERGAMPDFDKRLRATSGSTCPQTAVRGAASRSDSRAL